jgi:nicotinamidase-related amidase
LARKHTRLVQTLLDADVIVMAGQAASHCVKSSIEDFLTEVRLKDDSLVQKVYILGDCMSAVTVPDGNGGFVADFTPQAEAALEDFRKAGMHVVKSTDPIDSWPGIQL